MDEQRAGAAVADDDERHPPGDHQVERLDDFDRVVRAARPGLLAIAAAVTLDRAEAEDVVQDALARGFARWDEVGALARPDLWLRRVTVNRAIDVRRRRARFGRAFGRLTGEATFRTELGDTVGFWDAVGRLPRRQQEVIVLRAVEDLPVADIAVALDIAEGTVKTTLHAARARLAPLVAGDLADVRDDDQPRDRRNGGVR
jgi:RNA polymerase sigma-70 factor (ECF subfamily)